MEEENKYKKTFLQADSYDDAKDALEEVYEANPDAIIIVEEEGKECLIEHGKELRFVPSDVSIDALRQIQNKEDKFTPGNGLEMTSDRVLNVTIDSLTSEWFGTQDEYKDLGTYDDNTKYYIYEE